MEISITVPDDIALRLSDQWQDLPRHTLEALVADAYRHGVLTAGQVRRLLDLPARLEVDGFLKRAGAYLQYSESDLDQDARTLEGLLDR